MRNSKKLIALILTLFMCLTSICPTFAEKTEIITEFCPGQIIETHTSDDGKYSFVAMYAEEEGKGSSVSDPFMTVEEAGSYLRECFKNRETTAEIYFYVENAKDVYSEVYYALLDEAFIHTGVPTEGDYLYSAYSGNNTNISIYSNDLLLKYVFTNTYKTTAEQEAELDIAVDALLDELAISNLSAYQQIETLYDYMCSNIDYDYTTPDDHMRYTAYAALINKTCVCQGYATLFYRLCLEEGISARMITGTSQSVPHAWNIVLLKGLYYNLDSTWDSTNNTRYYFLKCNANFPDHDREEKFLTDEFNTEYPMADSDYVYDPLTDVTQATPAPTPTPTPTDEAEVYARSAVLYAGYALDRYVKTNGALPNYSTVGTATVYMPEMLGLFAQLIVDTNSGLSLDIAANSVTENGYIYEQLTEGELTKAQYTALARETLDYIAQNGKAPGCLECEQGTLSFNTLTAVFAAVLAEIRSSGLLPETTALTAWPSPLPIPPEEHLTEFSREGVLDAADRVNTYVLANNKYPSYITVEGEQVFKPEFLGIFAQLIVNENAGENISVARNDATYSENSYELITASEISRAQYALAAQAVLDHINASPSAAAPGFITTDIGTLSFETLLKVFVYALAQVKSTESLPEYIEVAAWTQTLPTPPVPTAVPEYGNLDFYNVIKGASRVLTTIESVATIPNYVTLSLDDGTSVRLYKGTMLRQFAATVSNINRGKTTDMPLQEIATPTKLVDESMTAGTLTKTQYIKLAQRIASAIYSSGAVPTYVSTDLGTMNYHNMIYLFSRVLDFYLAYGFLPDTMDVTPWSDAF